VQLPLVVLQIGIVRVTDVAHVASHAVGLDEVRDGVEVVRLGRGSPGAALRAWGAPFTR
jgi:hypothetical protein